MSYQGEQASFINGKHNGAGIQAKKTTAVEEGIYALQQYCIRTNRKEPVALSDQVVWANAAAEVLYPGEAISVSRQAIDFCFQNAIRKLRLRFGFTTNETWTEARLQLAKMGRPAEEGEALSATELHEVKHACNRWLISKGLDPNDGHFNRY